MSILCRVGLHRWSVWGVPEEITCVLTTFVASPFWSGEPKKEDVIRIRQTRQCANCGIIEHHWCGKPEQ